MSEQKQEELGIVVRIKAFLKLDEVGKISKFFEKEIKKFTSNIRDLENNAIQMKNIFESAKNRLEESLEDAKESLENAYVAVTEKDVTNNETMANFSEVYWKNITSKENKVSEIEGKIKDLQLAHDAELAKNAEQIQKYKTRIANLKKVK